MLKLYRGVRQKVYVKPDLIIEVLAFQEDQYGQPSVTLGFTCPKDVEILREEIMSPIERDDVWQVANERDERNE